MDSFRTEFEVPKGTHLIDYSSKILLMGSCFTENIGEKLSELKFNTCINPFGIVYNPESVAHSLEFLVKRRMFTEADLFEHQGVWNSFYHHSRFSDIQKEHCLEKINSQIEQGSQFLKNGDFLIITLGTAWVYQLKKSGRVVSNCHKVSAKEFERFRLSKCDIVEKLKSVLKKIKNQNLNLKIILTVSPVRHLKDGAVENQQSKATLLMAVHELTQELEKVSYFPAYEIMMDDLRDYRFYAEDMVHPSPTAIQYIWEKFSKTWVNESIKPQMIEIGKLARASKHRPFQPGSTEFQQFKKHQLKAIGNLEQQFPFMDFTTERQIFGES